METEAPELKGEIAKLVLILVAVVVFFAAVNKLVTPDKKNAREKPFLALVDSARKICTNVGSCVYDLTVRSGDWKHSLIASPEFDISEGDTVVMIKVHEDQIIAPSKRVGGKRRNYHYVLMAKDAR